MMSSITKEPMPRGDEDGNGAGQEEAQGAGPEELVDGVELTGLDGLVGTVDKRDVSGHDQDVQLLTKVAVGMPMATARAMALAVSVEPMMPRAAPTMVPEMTSGGT